jgi:hypothetical protein
MILPPSSGFNLHPEDEALAPKRTKETNTYKLCVNSTERNAPETKCKVS